MKRRDMGKSIPLSFPVHCFFLFHRPADTRQAPPVLSRVIAGGTGRHRTWIWSSGRFHGSSGRVSSDFDPSIRHHLFRYWYGRMHRNFDSDKAEALIQSMVQRNVCCAPTLVNIARHERTPKDLAANPALRFIPAGEPNTLASFGAEECQEWMNTLVRMKEFTRRFDQSGGLLIAGTDSPNLTLNLGLRCGTMTQPS